jgi:Protein of unknown function (DUF669)
MTMDLSGFNAEEIEPNASREPLPAGWYKVVITESEEKPTKAQTGSYLQLTLEVIEGDHSGRKAFERLNLKNPNAQAVEIAQRTLSGICRAVGVVTPRTSQDLHDKPLMAKIKVTPPRDGYDAGNEVQEYGPAGKTAAKPEGGKSTPPWKK